MCTYSQKVKSELINITQNRHNDIIEIATLIKLSSKIVHSPTNTNFNIVVNTENYLIALKLFTLIEKTFKINCMTRVIKKDNSCRYELLITPSIGSDVILKTTKIKPFENMDTIINPSLIKTSDDYIPLIRSCFISNSFISDPNKFYHVEFTFGYKNMALEIKKILEHFNISSKILKRRNHYIVYIKNSDSIVVLLAKIGAINTCFSFEDIRIFKDINNDVNRCTNCDIANIKRTVNAASQQIEHIKYIQKTVGLNKLKKELYDIAVLRLENPDISLKELGELLSPALGKSGVNYRMKKIIDFSNNIDK